MTTKDEALKRAQELLESMYEMMPNPSVGNAIEMCREAPGRQRRNAATITTESTAMYGARPLLQHSQD